MCEQGYKGKTCESNFKIVLLLTFSCMMLENGQTDFKNLVVFTPQDF